MWNLLSIVRELFRRGDLNAVSLLVILTEECLTNDQVLIWWFDSRSQASGNYSSHNLGNRGNTNAASTEATKHACAGFCDELVSLWRLAALNPKLTDEEREEVKVQLQEWHQKAVEKGCTGENKSYCYSAFLVMVMMMIEMVMVTMMIMMMMMMMMTIRMMITMTSVMMMTMMMMM